MGYSPTLDFTGSPIVSEFVFDQSFFRGVRGPVGSGKSTGMCGDIMAHAMLQEPAALDDVKYTRFAVIRNTSPELKATTIKTWEGIFPPDRCGSVVYSSPINHRIVIPPKNGNPGMNMETLFIALDKPKDVRKLLSLELTGAFVNEACEIPKVIIDGLTGRVGRYPSGEKGVPTFVGITADTNPPDDPDNWWHATETGGDNGADDDPLRWRFWAQPPAVIEVRPGDGNMFIAAEGDAVAAPGFRLSLIHI